MDLENKLTQFRTRRQLFKDCGFGVGKAALASMLADGLVGAGQTHFPAKADHVIFLFMAGGPSH